MTTRPDDHDDADGIRDPIAREWALQEAARLARRAGDAPAGAARALRYRLIADALDAPPEAALPSHFAHAQAQRIEAIVAERRRADARFVRRLKLGFALGYGGCVAAAAYAYRDALIAALQMPDVRAVVEAPWWPILIACAAWVAIAHARPWSRRAR
ncbi:MAG: hypothetical protein ACOY82_03555 [Pseudomonadota bacterium]